MSTSDRRGTSSVQALNARPKIGGLHSEAQSSHQAQPPYKTVPPAPVGHILPMGVLIADAHAGIEWWNGLPEADRYMWLAVSNGESVADAWKFYNAVRPRGRA